MEAQIYAGDRIALVGANGAGKSTLLRAIAGNPAPAVVTGGEIRKEGCSIAVVDQNQLALLEGHLDDTPVDFLLQRHACLSLKGKADAARKILGQFGLSGDTAMVPIGALSGGLRVRLLFADVFADDTKPLDLLLLDEPTNHLDGETIAALAAALKTFPGRSSP